MTRMGLQADGGAGGWAGERGGWPGVGGCGWGGGGAGGGGAEGEAALVKRARAADRRRRRGSAGAHGRVPARARARERAGRLLCARGRSGAGMCPRFGRMPAGVDGMQTANRAASRSPSTTADRGPCPRRRGLQGTGAGTRQESNPRSVKGVRYAPRRKLKHPRDLVDVIVRPVPRSLDNKVIVAIKLAHRLKRER